MNAQWLQTLLLTAALLTPVACSRDNLVDTPSPERLFEEAQAAADRGGLFGSRDCFTAERKVEELRRRYPYHAATLEGELILADCAFKDKRTMEAIGRWEAFLRFHRGHPAAPRVWMSLATAYQSLYDDYDRDMGSVTQALHAASNVVREHPQTETAHTALEVRNWARNTLATHEHYVAGQYRRGGHLLSARTRLERLLAQYPDTDIAPAAEKDLKRLNKRIDFPDYDEIMNSEP